MAFFLTRNLVMDPVYGNLGIFLYLLFDSMIDSNISLSILLILLDSCCRHHLQEIVGHLDLLSWADLPGLKENWPEGYGSHIHFLSILTRFPQSVNIARNYSKGCLNKVYSARIASLIFTRNAWKRCP